MPFDQPPGELISRFIFDSGKIRPSDNTAKHTAFVPPENGRLSIFWTTGLPEAEIWEICNVHVSPHLGRPVKARADLNSLAVYAQNLTVTIDGVPHPRHGNIEGWDFTTDTRLQCLKLAAAAGNLRLPAV
jgi:hypothetical protein